MGGANNMRKGNYIGTYNGGRFWVTDPQVQDVEIEEIAHSLSLNCRFNGHTRHLWTVAQHSILVSDICFYEDPFIGLIGLLHDASEGYISDIARPFKHVLEKYLDIEKQVQKKIYEACGIEVDEIDEGTMRKVKEADDLALSAEAHKLMNPCDDWISWGGFDNPNIKTLERSIRMENPQLVKGKYIRRLMELLKINGKLGKSIIFQELGLDWCAGMGRMIPIIENGEVMGYVAEEKDCYTVYSPDYKIIAEYGKEVIDNSQNLIMLIK